MQDVIKVTLTPVRMDVELRLERRGQTLIINGDVCDLAILAEQDDEAAEAQASMFIAGPVIKSEVGFHVTVLRPYGAGQTPPAPVVIDVQDDGPVAAPWG